MIRPHNRLLPLQRAILMIRAAVVILALPFGATPIFADPLEHALEIGRTIVIKPRETRVPITARVIQIPDQTEPSVSESAAGPILTLRARIDAIDDSLSQFRVLGHSVIVDGSTRAPATIRSISDLHEGQWIKLKLDTVASGQWHASRIETNRIDKRTKIEGRVTAIWKDSVSVGGLVVRLPDNVRIDEGTLSPSERLFTDLLSQRDPSQPPPWLNGGWYWSRGKIVMNQRIENDFTVGDSASDHYREAEPQVKLDFSVRGPHGLSSFLKLRSRNTFVWENAPLRRRSREMAVQLYEGFVLWRDIAGLPVAAQVGRQDFDEYREWIFDDQLDAVRMYVYPLHPIIIEGAYINSMDNSSDNKFRTLADFLLYAHGRPIPSTELSAYRLWRTDSDVRGREPIWTGLRWRGTYLGIKPWLDLAWLGGWDKGRRFDASARDLGATVSRRFGNQRLSLTVSSARSSGNTEDPKSTGIDRQFHQTGYEDNTGLYDGMVSFQYYGEIFDPELANLDILTVGGGFAFSDRASCDVVYHRFNQSEYSEAVSRDLEATDLTLYDLGGRGTDPANGRPVKELFPYQHVGWELDVILGIARVFGLVDIKWVTGFFVPQDALSPPFWEQLPFKPKKRTAYLSQLSLEYRF